MNKLTGPEGMEIGSCFDVYSSNEYPTQNWNTLLNTICTGRLAHTSHEKSIRFLSGLDLIWHCLPLSLCPFRGTLLNTWCICPHSGLQTFTCLASLWCQGASGPSWPHLTLTYFTDPSCVSLLLSSGGLHFNRQRAEAVEQRRPHRGNTWACPELFSRPGWACDITWCQLHLPLSPGFISHLRPLTSSSLKHSLNKLLELAKTDTWILKMGLNSFYNWDTAVL